MHVPYQRTRIEDRAEAALIPHQRGITPCATDANVVGGQQEFGSAPAYTQPSVAQ